jgi:hypothetical protein
MKCPSCEKEWPAGVKFCGQCGTKIPERDTGGLTLDQAKVDEQLRTMIPKIGIGKFHVIGPGHYLCQRGSTHVDVRIIDFNGQVAVRSVAPVAIGSNLCPELMKFLLNNNAGFIFGAFGLDPQGNVIFSHTILASSIDENELGASMNTVLLIADRFDNEIVNRWGGKTMAQTVIDKVLPASIVQLLRRAPVGN